MGTPVQVEVETAPGPHLKPADLRVKFCSWRRFPQQVRVTGIVREGRERRSVIVNSRGSGISRLCACMLKEGFVNVVMPMNAQRRKGKTINVTYPLTATLQESQFARGTGPWFLTKWSSCGVIVPAFHKSGTSGSALNGWAPVNLTILGSRLIHSSVG